MKQASPKAIVFFVVVLDLIGFGMVIPLINLYGIHYGAGTVQLAVLASAYSAMQFIFAPFWGALSDRIGRRPVLLVSLFGSTLSYLIFGLASSYEVLLISRVLAGIFAANISAAQAYMADITDRKDRAGAMGLIGAAFGIGFTLGPPLGGVTAKWYGLGYPGYLASALSGATLLIALFYLPESLPAERRRVNKTTYRFALGKEVWRTLAQQPQLRNLVYIFFIATLAFAQFEQAFAPYLQARFEFATDETGYKAGIILLWLGIIGVVMQGFVIRKLTQRYAEHKLLALGLLIEGAAFLVVPLLSTYGSFFLFGCLIPIGAGMANPCLSALISLSAGSEEQGSVLGIAQGFSSLARVIGPAFAMLLFSYSPYSPFIIGSFLVISTVPLAVSAGREK
ncbi:MAG: MFS transporter [Deltaproteobacteria bacterium]|nr:MFS transporter [Deltaproteobacteria bacterium]